MVGSASSNGGQYGFFQRQTPWKGSTAVSRMQVEKSRLSRAYSCFWTLHFTYFISSVVSIFKVDTLKLREGKRVLLVTQLLGGRVRTEPRYPQLLVQDFLSVTPLPPRPGAHWC